MFANLCLTTTKTATADWCQNINKWAELLFITISRREINVCLMMPHAKDEILMKYEWNIQKDVNICFAVAAILCRSRVQTANTSSPSLLPFTSTPPTPSTLSTLCWRRTFVKHATDKSTLTCSICACAIASRQDKLGVKGGGRGATAEWQKSRGRGGEGKRGGRAYCVASALAATRRMIDDAKVHKLPKRNTNKMN